MGKALRSKWGLLALVAAMVVGMATIPAVGEHSPESSDVLRLHMGADGNYFQHEAADGSVIEKKDFSPSNNCRLNVDNSLVTLSGSSSPGYHNQSIGVRGSGGNGVPCSRVDSSESLTVTLGTGLSALAAELDLELKGAASVLITLSNGEAYTLVSGGGDPGSASVTLDSSNTSANCRGSSDSGPDSGPNDNCRVLVHPDSAFTSITFSLSSGEMSLEGGGDFFPSDPGNDTIFYLETWDGVLSCVDDPGTEEQENSTGEEEDGDGAVVVEIIRHRNADGTDCVDKLYRLVPDAEDEEDGSVIFEVFDPATQPMAFFEAYVTFKDGSLEPGFTPIVASTLEYDPDGSDGYSQWETMPACLEAPFDGNGDPVPDAFTPEYEGCVISVTQDYEGATTWHAVFMGDWKFR